MTPSLSPNSSYLFATKKSETTHTPTAMRSTFRDIDIRSRSHTTYVSEKDSQTIASSKPVQKQGVFKMRKLSRREQVLAHFVKGQDMSIKDISAKVKGCSEKTIQRELNSLVLDHVIERIGEKRWSRYILR
jgi:predicted HTH transcriptional regulator